MSTLLRAAPIRLDEYANGLVMSPREFDQIEDFDEGYIYELINGVVVVSPLPYPGEASPNEMLGGLLFVYQTTHPHLDETLANRYVYCKDHRRIADRLIWTGLGREPSLEHDLPSIVIEFVSRRKRDYRRDYVEKRKEYAALRIPEYWIIDRFRRTMTVCRPRRTPLIVQELETYESPLLPGFVLPLAAILKRADRYAK